MRNNFLNTILRVILVMTAAATLPGCDSVIYDEEGDCDPVHVIRFSYEMNMKFTDAFPAEVPSVDLYVFDSDGRLVTTVSRDVTREDAHDFSIELRGLAPGHYDLLAWCGVKDSEHFIVNPDRRPEPVIGHHICRIDREDAAEDGAGHIRDDIRRLYHGALYSVDMTADEGRHEHTVYLTKDTNVVRVVLQHMSGAPMDKNDYDISITDVNGLYDHRNDLLPDGMLTYHPWAQTSATASFFPEDEPETESRVTTSVSAVVAELTVGRLMAAHRENAALTVRNAHTGSLIFSIPVIDYMLMVRGHYYQEDGITPMGEQEYLDRQDEYPMTFFLDDQDEWISTVIYINQWRIVRNDSSIH